MSTISQVLYTEIEHDRCSPESTSEFYFLHNMIGIDTRFIGDYQTYELNEYHFRSAIIREMMEQEQMMFEPKVNTTIFGISALKNKAVIITEV